MSKKSNPQELAILGGEPVRKKAWPLWPKVSSNTEKLINEVLHSGRWAISGPYLGKESFERKFSRDFADFNGVKFCTPVMNGTSSLVTALLGLGIGYKDEVLVPGLTWVACASTVASIGAIPILVDINKSDFCISVEAAKKAITKNTKAIMIVHSFGGVADIDGFLELSKETGIPIIEDCSQAHGAKWLNKNVGSFGKVGCFSMQQSKLLTCGEGGAVITNDEALYLRFEQLRSDGRIFTKNPKKGQLELVELGQVQGRNMCLSEFQSAILYDRLKYLETENKKREENASYLKGKLSEIEGIKIQKLHHQVTSPAYYNFLIQFDLDIFKTGSIDSISIALSEELNLFARPVYQPLNNNKLYNPLSLSRLPYLREDRDLLDPKRFHLPNAEMIRKTSLTLPHQVLLDSEEGMDDIVIAIKKIKDKSGKLPQTGVLAAI